MRSLCSRGTGADAGDATRILVMGGHAFIEIGSNYLLWIGTQAQVGRLSRHERWALINAVLGLTAEMLANDRASHAN